jgi:uncharacterized protein YbjT (DUF2867 family)
LLYKIKAKMKIVLTGSLGHISRPLTEELVQKGHSVTVISSKAERQKEVEALGATAAIGTVEDVHFLSEAFSGADAVYCMIPPGSFADPDYDVLARVNKVAHNYAKAIRNSEVKQVVHLSSIGAHTNIDNGLLILHFNMEKTLKELPMDVAITTMRPCAFYYNLLSFAGMIKNGGFMASNYGKDDIVPWVSPLDIAAAVAEEIGSPFTGRKVRYVASEEISCNEIAGIIGEAISKPDLKWKVISNEQMESGMISTGMRTDIAKGLVEMNASMHLGKLFDDYYRNRPILGKTKMKDFAKEFAAVYNS